MRTALLLSLSILLASCAAAPRIFTTEVDTLHVASPEIFGVLPADTNVVHHGPLLGDGIYYNPPRSGLIDTVLSAIKVVKHDTVISVRYYPKLKVFTFRAKPDSITVLHMDTVAKIVEKKVAPPFSQKVGYALIGGVILIIIGLLIFIFMKYLLPIVKGTIPL